MIRTYSPVELRFATGELAKADFVTLADHRAAMLEAQACQIPAMTKDYSDYIADLLKDAARDARQDDPDCGIFANDDYAAMLERLSDAVENAPQPVPCSVTARLNAMAQAVTASLGRGL